ncbi:hypothetical protein ACFLYB_06190 [Chloroflexota bacterium]
MANKFYNGYFISNPLQTRLAGIEIESRQGVTAMLWIMTHP